MKPVRLLQGPGLEPTFNVSLDHALLNVATDQTRQGVIRIWRNSPSVVVGRVQDIDQEVNTDYCFDNQIQIVRRLSGGGTVYHDPGNLNTSFIFPMSHIPAEYNVQAISNYFTKLMIDTLDGLGYDHLEQEGSTNIFMAGKKISGSAGHLRKGWFLHHATLLLNTNLEHLNNSLLARESYPDNSKASRYFPTINVPDLDLARWQSAITEQISQALGVTVVKTDFSRVELGFAERLDREMYSTDRWTYQKKRKLIRLND